MNLSTKKWLFAGFLVYGVALFLCFTVYRLPSEELLQSGLNQFTEGKVLFKAQSISPTFPLGYRMENVQYSILLTGDFYKNNLKFLNIYPDYLGLIEGYFPMTMKGALPRGHFQIEAGTSILKGSRDGFVSLKASDAYFDDLGFLKGLTGRTLKGKVTAEMNLKGNLDDYTRISGDGRVFVEGGSLESQVPFLALKEIPFKSLRVLFSVKEGLLSLKELELAGPVLSGRISGDIRLRKPLEQSLLHLTARLTPGSGLSDTGGAVPLPEGKDGLMVVRMEGMLRNPNLLWSQ